MTNLVARGLTGLALALMVASGALAQTPKPPQPGGMTQTGLPYALPDLDTVFEETGTRHRGLHRVTCDHLLTRVGDPVLARTQADGGFRCRVPERGARRLWAWAPGYVAAAIPAE